MPDISTLGPLALILRAMVYISSRDFGTYGRGHGIRVTQA